MFWLGGAVIYDKKLKRVRFSAVVVLLAPDNYSITDDRN